jgi:hypothetical protein
MSDADIRLKWHNTRRLPRGARYGLRALVLAVIFGSLVVTPILALAIYGAWSLITSGEPSSNGYSGAIQITWDIRVNRKAKGDRIRPAVTQEIERRFVFNVILPKDIPLPRPKPDELIALQASPVDPNTALSGDKTKECNWDKFELVPDFMRSCVPPPLYLVPPSKSK